MRFKLKLKVLSDYYGNAIPLNYQYELSAAIYKIISKSSLEYSTWLHENGFIVDERKRFKLFTFSRLIVPNFGIDKVKQRLILKCDTVDWYISFLPEKSTQKFIQGVFKEQTFSIGDRVSSVQFAVQEVQIMPGLEFSDEMTFETLSPLCISQRNDDNRTDYLPPTAPNYSLGILTGLMARYKAYHGHDFEGELYCDFTLLNEPKPMLVKIKADTPQQTFVKGYMCRFKLRLPAELMEIAYEAGVGEKTSTGFGMIKAIYK